MKKFLLPLILLTILNLKYVIYQKSNVVFPNIFIAKTFTGKIANNNIEMQLSYFKRIVFYKSIGKLILLISKINGNSLILKIYSDNFFFY